MKCFVIMPFGDPKIDPTFASRSNSLYEKWIKRAVEAVADPERTGANITCSRADKSHRVGDVIEHIVEDLVESEIVIADLTGRNANVFYELGVRHATSTGTILIAQSEEDIPFDLRRQRTYFYRYDPDSLLELQSNLTSAVLEIIKDRGRIDSQVRRYLFERETRKLSQANAQPGYDVIRDILVEMSNLKSEFARELKKMQELVLTSVAPKDVANVREDAVLSSLEGVWRKEEGFGLFCARIVDDELRIPYCYGGTEHLDSHFWDVKLVNRLLVARFSWFCSPHYTGFLMLQVESSDRLSGGWWFDDDFPEEQDFNWLVRNANRRLFDDYGLHRMVLVRDSALTEFPDWAESYFTEMKWRRPRTSEA
jgi:hypothetical protein